MSGSTNDGGGGGGNRLRLRDVRSVFRLVGEVRELGADPDRWRPHMVLGIRRIVEAEIVVSSEVHFRRDKRGGEMRVVDIGWISDAADKVCKVHTDRGHEQPEEFWLAVTGGDPSPEPAPAGPHEPAEGTTAGGTPGEARAANGAPAARGAQGEGELVPIKPKLKVYGGRSFILSQYPLPHAGAVDQLGLHRAWGDAPFTPAHHKIVRLLHVEMGRLWRRDAMRRASEPNAALPPRLQQTLEELLSGKSEKEIALKLELSRHTIHNYVKALHQRFGVSSRGELLARAGKDRTVFTPQLSLELPRGK
jgi:DNA-binding CsgD family transcriptional regulator